MPAMRPRATPISDPMTNPGSERTRLAPTCGRSSPERSAWVKWPAISTGLSTKSGWSSLEAICQSASVTRKNQSGSSRYGYRGAPRLCRGASERWGLWGAISGPPTSLARGRDVGARLLQRGVEEGVGVDVAERGGDRLGHARMPGAQRRQKCADLAAHAGLVRARAADGGEPTRPRVRGREIFGDEHQRPHQPQRAPARAGDGRQRRDAPVEEDVAQQRFRAVVGGVSERQRRAAALGGQAIERTPAMAAADVAAVCD